MEAALDALGSMGTILDALESMGTLLEVSFFSFSLFFFYFFYLIKFSNFIFFHLKKLSWMNGNRLGYFEINVNHFECLKINRNHLGRDWNRFYDNRIYRKSIRIDFKIDYRIKSNLLIVAQY